MASSSNNQNNVQVGGRGQAQSNSSNQHAPRQERQTSGNSQGRYWVGTINVEHGLFVPPTELRPGSNLVWLRGQQEIGASGNLHWQLFCAFKNKVRTNTVKGVVGNGHWELSRSEAAEAYVWKEDTRVAGTQFELGQKAFQRNNPLDWKRIKDLAKAGRVEQILDDEPEVAIRHYRTLKQIAVDYLACPPNLPGPSGKWIYGPPGVGKSFWVREQWGQDLYIKAQNKWWDGYRGQRFVLLDDFDSKVLGHYLKIWTDAYAFTAETKGGTIQIRPDLFIITSNYKPEELFEDPLLAEAVSRRCQRIFMPFRRG